MEKENFNAIFVNLNREPLSDLSFLFCGIHKCDGSYGYGPTIRHEYIIHYIISGEGTYYVNNTEYKLKENQGFLICPNSITYYQANKDNPWTYLWVGFNGNLAKKYLNYAGLDETKLIFHSNDNDLKDCIKEMIDNPPINYHNELLLHGLMYKFLAKLSMTSNISYIGKTSNHINSYIEKSVEYINKHYSGDIKIQDIADELAIHRSYLSKIFKQVIGKSPQEYLVYFRVNKAIELLEKTDLPISEISNLVGYYDQVAFSKIFKKLQGVSPNRYRALINTSIDIKL
ncbi:AraC family transcriptional regulator [Clostridioides difficile]